MTSRKNEKLEAIRRLANDPRTPPHEAEAAREALRRMLGDSDDGELRWVEFNTHDEFEFQLTLFLTVHVCNRELERQMKRIGGFSVKISTSEELEINRLLSEMRDAVYKQYKAEYSHMRMQISIMQAKLKTLPADIAARMIYPDILKGKNPQS